MGILLRSESSTAGHLGARPRRHRVFVRFMLDLQLIKRARRKMACGEMDSSERDKVDGFEADAFQHLTAQIDLLADLLSHHASLQDRPSPQC